MQLSAPGAESGFTRVKNNANIHDEHADGFASRKPVLWVAALETRQDEGWVYNRGNGC